MTVPISSGLVLHLETDRGLATYDGVVTSWADASASGNDLSSTGDPTLGVIRTPSGAPAIELDGASDKLERTLGLTGLPSGNQDRTIFFVVDYENPEGVVAGAVFGDSARNESFGLGVSPANGDLMVPGYGNANDIQSGAEGVAGGFLVQSALLSSGQLTQYLNGVATNTTAHNFNPDLQRLVIGEEIGSKGFADLNVAAVLIYDRALDET